MEIVDYLAIARRSLLVLVGIPVLAAALALTYLLVNPRPAVASVYVSAPQLMGSQYGTYPAQGASQFASNFIATASSPAVRAAVARQTGVGVGDIEDGLNLEQVDLSSVVTITYTTRDSSTAGPVASAVARQTLTSMFGSQVRLARAAVDSARKLVHNANAALAALAEEHGSLPLAQRYETLTAQITVLANERARYLAQGEAPSADVLAKRLKKLRSRAAGLASITAEQADLLAQQQAATNTLTTSQQVLAQATAQLSAADPSQVHPPPVREVPLPRLIVTVVLPAAAVGVFLAIALVALLELIAQRRKERGPDRERLLVSPRPPVKPSAAGPVRRPMSPQDLQAAE